MLRVKHSSLSAGIRASCGYYCSADCSAVLAVTVIVALSLSIWDRSRRLNVDLPVRPMVFFVAKIAAYLLVGGGIVFMLNLPQWVV